MYPEAREMGSYGFYEVSPGSARFTKGDLPARALVGKRFKIMDQAVTGTPQPGSGLPKRRPVFCSIREIVEGENQPILMTFQDKRRPDRRYSFMEFAELQVRLADPVTGSYVDLND